MISNVQNGAVLGNVLFADNCGLYAAYQHNYIKCEADEFKRYYFDSIWIEFLNNQKNKLYRDTYNEKYHDKEYCSDKTYHKKYNLIS